MPDNIVENKKHFVVATCIIVKDGKYLLTKRADWEKAFPGRWTVPGGKLDATEYAARAKDTAHHWYNVIEDLTKREVKEETDLEIKNLGYVTSMVYIRPDGVPCLVISMFGEYANGEIKLCDALTEHAWATLEEARKYYLIEGILEELEILDAHLKGEKMKEWKKK